MTQTTIKRDDFFIELLSMTAKEATTRKRTMEKYHDPYVAMCVFAATEVMDGMIRGVTAYMAAKHGMMCLERQEDGEVTEFSKRITAMIKEFSGQAIEEVTNRAEKIKEEME